MIISCPRCETSFSLPDELYKPGKKARCSNCGFVFVMPAAAADKDAVETTSVIGETAPPVPSGTAQGPKKSRALLVLIGILLLLALAYGAYLVFTTLLASPKFLSSAANAPVKAEAPVPDGKKQEQERLVSAISLEEIRQFLVDNVEVGKLMVIQGFAVNTSQAGKDYISVGARILDEKNQVLARTQQLCGVPLTLFQLQTLPEKELKEALANRTTILVNNTNVPPGGKVPFVVVFPNPPDSMRTFEVQVVDVKESPPS